ncbi:hypothetical protein NN561_001537 [Cricetulus griseus]
MSSGDVRHDPCKLRSQFHRALWQAGQPPCAPLLGVGGPAPGVGGAGATSGPDVSPQPHPGGAGYRRQRPQGAARTKGAGSLERAPEGPCGRAPAPCEGRGQWQTRTPLALEYSSPPIRASRGPYWPRDLRAPVGVPLDLQEEGRKSEPSARHGDA